MDHVMDKKPEMADIINTEINMFKEVETKMLKINPKYKNVNVDTINAVKFNTEYEASIQVHQDGEINNNMF